MEEIVQLLVDNGFIQNESVWIKEIDIREGGQVLIVNGVRQEIPGKIIPMKQIFEDIGSAELFDDEDNLEQTYKHIHLSVELDGEEVGSIGQLFYDGDEQEVINLIRQVFKIF